MKVSSSRLALAILFALPLFSPFAAHAGCEGTVSATALGLAKGDDRLRIALESFGIDPSLTELFRPTLQSALDNTDAVLATTQLRNLCLAFAGTAPPTALAAASVVAPATSPPPGPARKDIEDKLDDLECAPYRINPSGKKAMGSRCARVDRSTAQDPASTGAPQTVAQQPSLARREDRDWLPQPTESREEIERVVDDAHRKYLEVRRAAEDDAKLKPDLARAELALMQAERDARLVLPGYGLYVGPTFLLEPGGGFKEAFELSARYDSGRFTYPAYSETNTDKLWVPDGWVRGFFDLTYRSTDTTDDESNDQTPDSDGYFGRDDGRVRVNLGAQWHFLNQRVDALGVAGGLGFTAPLADNDQDPANDYQRGATRWFLGLHSLTNYRVGVGELMLGYAKDRYWDVRCPAATPPAVLPAYCGDYSSRYFAEGLFTLAKEDASDWSVIGKLSADIPTDSDGQADIAISVLLRRDLDAFLTGFKKD